MLAIALNGFIFRVKVSQQPMPTLRDRPHLPLPRELPRATAPVFRAERRAARN